MLLVDVQRGRGRDVTRFVERSTSSLDAPNPSSTARTSAKKSASSGSACSIAFTRSANVALASAIWTL